MGIAEADAGGDLPGRQFGFAKKSRGLGEPGFAQFCGDGSSENGLEGILDQAQRGTGSTRDFRRADPFRGMVPDHVPRPVDPFAGAAVVAGRKTFGKTGNAR